MLSLCHEQGPVRPLGCAAEDTQRHTRVAMPLPLQDAGL